MGSLPLPFKKPVLIQSIRITKHRKVLARLLQFAWHQNRTAPRFPGEQYRPHQSVYLREFIDQGLTDLEAYYLAAEVLERVRKGQESVHSAAEVRKDLGLDD
ncbi:type II toxin-antitoxin system RelB family antitoxin [Pseudomonas capeferrum]|uniref:type II toxin-antitoxin system RelB family antitoxin n=1 Tax=Pseudomonas capeferrum TaxID=1495066 RepID=UPI004046D2FA